MTAREKLAEFVLGLLPFAAGILLVGGIVHIISILALPWLATRDAFARVAPVAPLNRMTLVSGGETSLLRLPFEDPATVVSICRFDLSKGMLRLSANLPPDELLLFSFHGRHGEVFYSMTDRGASRGHLDILVLTRLQQAALEAGDSEDELPRELRIPSPSTEGFVMLRAFAEQPGDLEAARKRATAIGCVSEAARPG